MVRGTAPRFSPGRGRRLVRGAGAGAVLLAVCLGLVACGGGSGDDSGAEELARQRELAAARQQAAQDARQAERVKQLEREVATLKKDAAPASDTELVVPPDSQPVDPPGDWPGGSGYTAILASLGSEGEARVVQGEASGRGLDAGILFSSDFSSLRPGYWVVFSGTFATVGKALERAERAHSAGYVDSYPRFVSP